ncbi:MAG: type I 3-dehydroquinate dehydratase [Verrucomicrobia bacterium]|nr:type I 3-dehydroquinate dehydratase [Verrucomicrobiota bacterium]
MSRERVSFSEGKRWVVGSIGSAAALAEARPTAVPTACDLLEIRLDALAAGGTAVDRAAWAHLADVPLLFTARRRDEGGAGDLDATTRAELLRQALRDAAVMDVELASTAEMEGILQKIPDAGIPWVASFHDFERLPADEVLAAAAKRARDAGAAVFKLAARIHGPDDLARLARFQASDPGLPLAVMGMGPLAPVSRLLCAQYGSALNYGYLGETPTAPGQWDCATLKRAIGMLDKIG